MQDKLRLPQRWSHPVTEHTDPPAHAGSSGSHCVQSLIGFSSLPLSVSMTSNKVWKYL